MNGAEQSAPDSHLLTAPVHPPERVTGPPELHHSKGRYPSPFCGPEEDPFLLLESSLKAIERFLQLRRGLPLRRSWIDYPYGEEEITRLEEEVIPAIQRCLARVDELDERLLAQQERLQRWQPMA